MQSTPSRHSMAAGRDFGKLDLQAARNFRDAAAEAGIRRIVYLGGLIPPNPESEHLQSRYETGECLRSARIPVTELRAGMTIGPGSAAFEVIRDLVNYLPVMITPRWVYSRSPPIALGDLLTYMTRLAYIDQAAGEIYDAGGPELMTYAEIMRRFGRLINKHPIIIPVPVLSPRLSSYWLRLVTSVPINVARASVYPPDPACGSIMTRDSCWCARLNTAITWASSPEACYNCSTPMAPALSSTLSATRSNKMHPTSARYASSSTDVDTRAQR